jgi:hypothetical protein
LISAATAAAVLALLAAPHATTPSSVTIDGATAQVTGSYAELYDAEISQRWAISRQDEVSTVELADGATGRDWAAASAPDFQLELNGVTTSSEQVWHLLSATARTIPYSAARPTAGPGVQIVFRYGIASDNGLIELDRTWSLYAGDATENVSEVLWNHTPLLFRIGLYSLAQMTSAASVSAQVETYHGGADWRQDFRVTTDPRGTFDDEGEVASFDAGDGAGWFLVGQRRSGVMSRVGDDDGRSWVGVDNARDLFDFGPILTSPPNYNRLNNPLYPVPLRGRTLLSDNYLDLGQAFLGVYHGGAQQAAAAFVHDFAGNVMATGRTTVDLNTFHPWEHGSGMSAANLEPQARIFKRLGGEVFMLDDQWQGKSAGDWNWDTQRYPITRSGGVPDFVNYLHSLGLQLGLWMSPAEFNPGSTTYKQHPAWACTPTGDVTAQIQDDSGLGIWNMNYKPLQQHLTAVINRLISKDGVREFKFDYVAWVDCPPLNYLDYEDAYVHWVQLQEALHPGVTFELDETNDQRLWPFRSVALGPSWFDNGHLQGSSYPSRLLHDVYDAAPWIPPSDLGFGLYDSDLEKPYTPDYLMPIALLGHVTFWTDLTKLTPVQLAETAWWIKWYKANRSGLGGLVYEDSDVDPINGSASAAFQPWDGTHGYLFAFRQDGAAAQTVALQGLNPAGSYVLTNVRTGKWFGKFTGARLAAGLVVTQPAEYSALVLSIEPSARHAGKRPRVS